MELNIPLVLKNVLEDFCDFAKYGKGPPLISV